MTSFTGRLLELALGVLAPQTCAACGEPERNGVFCAACGVPAPTGPLAIDGVPVLAAGRYAPPLSSAIRRFKFERHPELARPLASIVLPALAGLDLEPGDAWVPVPLHRKRLVERGFNQSALLARSLAASMQGHFVPRALERRRETDQQAQLGREARSENVGQAFALRERFAGSRVLLVDDVVTTGATARACLRPFREANIGVLAVVALALAAP